MSEIMNCAASLASDINWAAWTPIGVSLLALGAILWQAHVARVHNRLSVRPMLEGHSYSKSESYSLEVRNDGLGPAVITAARVYRSEKLVEGEGIALVENAFSGIAGCQLVSHEFIHTPFVLPAGQSIKVFEVSYDPAIPDIEAHLAGVLQLQLEYESAYKEKFPIYKTRRPLISDAEV